MDERIKKELEQEQATPFHDALLKHVKALIDMSRSQMSERYADWDSYDQTYRGQRSPDKEDCKAKKDGAPTKMVVPITFSQVQTAVAFCFSVFYQKEKLIHLVGTGPEDHVSAKVGEALLERDFRTNIMDSKLFQFLVDIFKFGIGVFKTGWVREEVLTKKKVPQAPVQVFGQTVGEGRELEVEVREVKYLGNRIYNVSPYRFYPDTRLPLSRFQEGEFCGSEDEYSMVSLKRMEQEGTVAGLQWVKGFTTKDLEKRGESRFANLREANSAEMGKRDTAQSQGIVIVTECQVTLIPNAFIMDDGKPLSDSAFPEKWNVWYANDQRVIKAEPLGYEHQLYTYDVAEFLPDQHKLLNEGLSEMTDPLQSVISWFINSHITSVRKVVQNRLVVDPEALDMNDIADHKHIIRLKPGMGKLGIDRFVHQLQVQDVTANHIADVEFLHKMVQVVTGVNDNALGQFHTGRRSATEARAVSSAAAARLQLSARLIWKMAIEPMAGKMLANLRSGLDVPTYIQVAGEGKGIEPYAQFMSVTSANLAGNYDFEVFDGTSPSDRMYQAEVIKELLLGLMGNPNFIPFFGYDPRKLMHEMLELRGLRNPERFMLTVDQLAATLQTQGVGNGMAGAGQEDAVGAAGASAGASGGAGGGFDPSAGLVG